MLLDKRTEIQDIKSIINLYQQKGPPILGSPSISCMQIQLFFHDSSHSSLAIFKRLDEIQTCRNIF